MFAFFNLKRNPIARAFKNKVSTLTTKSFYLKPECYVRKPHLHSELIIFDKSTSSHWPGNVAGSKYGVWYKGAEDQGQKGIKTKGVQWGGFNINGRMLCPSSLSCQRNGGKKTPKKNQTKKLPPKNATA